MEYHRQSHGWLTFLEHWGIPLMLLGVFGLSSLMMFFINLRGQGWLKLFTVAMGLLLAGSGLILAAKLPSYRQGRLFTFGAGSVPERLLGCYRWGWRFFGLGMALSLGLLLSRS